MSVAVAHQRRIRDDLAARHPRAPAASLHGYHVELVGREQAVPIIQQYEWLGTIGRATLFAGLRSPALELEGVACFGHGPAGPIRDLIGTPALCLERGACVHYAPPNAASFLTARACKLIARLHGIERFFAYCDPEAGEYGAIYQAAGWLYLGQGLDGGKGRARRLFVLAPGKDHDDPAAWQTTRALRRPPLRLSLAEARALGWSVMTREAKHVYAVHVGRERKRWRDRLVQEQCRTHGAPLPYPAPRPSLKLRVT